MLNNLTYLVNASTKYLLSFPVLISLKRCYIVLSTSLASLFLSSLLKNSYILSNSEESNPKLSVSVLVLSLDNTVSFLENSYTFWFASSMFIFSLAYPSIIYLIQVNKGKFWTFLNAVTNSSILFIRLLWKLIIPLLIGRRGSNSVLA